MSGGSRDKVWELAACRALKWSLVILVTTNFLGAFLGAFRVFSSGRPGRASSPHPTSGCLDSRSPYEMHRTELPTHPRGRQRGVATERERFSGSSATKRARM